MIANKIEVTDIFDKTVQYTIPLYQRKYSWEREEVDDLLEDIKRAGIEGKTHFIGSLVYMIENAYDEEIKVRTVIDGQQRLTTLTLITLVLLKLVKKYPEELNVNYDKIINTYILNQYEKEYKRKITLTYEDDKTLSKIINSIESDIELEFDDMDSIRIKENFERIETKINKDNFNNYYNGLHKLYLISISLEPQFDNPQDIFESLNSTGKALNDSDLIRNYILMGLTKEEQDTLYEQYWKNIEDGFNQLPEKNNQEFERFIKDYITIKEKGNIPTKKEIYRKFKKIKTTYEGKVEDLLKEMLQYARYYFKIINQKEEDKDLKEVLNSLEKFEFKVTRPLLLNLYEDYANNTLTKEDFIDIIEIIESYVIRRNLCSYNTNTLNDTFSYIYYDLDKTNLLESFKIELLLLTDKKVFPNNIELRENLKTCNLYNNKKCYDILEKIENYHEKEIFVSKVPTIEHILPKNSNLSKPWRNMLGENWRELQEKYIHTIGNLTITGYNSELGDKPFEEKKYMEKGYNNSKSKLTRELIKYDVWNQYTIEERAEHLTDRIINEIWRYPTVDENKLNEIKEERKDKPKQNNTKGLHREYWTIIQDKIIQKGYTTRSVQDWSSFDLSNNKKSRFVLGLIFSKNQISLELYMNSPKKELYNYLLEQKTDIEEELGEINCEWKENRSSAKIITYYSIDASDKNNWDNAMEWHLTTLDKFDEIFTKRINIF